MSPEQASERLALRARVLARIRAFEQGSVPFEPHARAVDAELDVLLEDLARYQQRWVAPYARFCAQRSPRALPPALPTDAFRVARVSSQPETADVRAFRSSGTTQAERSSHCFADLGLYDAAARAAARPLLFPERERMRLLIVAPGEHEVPDSSLSYMLARFVEWFGTDASRPLWPLDAPQLTALTASVRDACDRGEPLALLGTSFAFVHLMDALGEQRFSLPPGSRIMQTGGFKGRSRELSPEAMRTALGAQFGVPDAAIVAEYGMTELSSQLYETTLRDSLSNAGVARRLWWPPWLRVRVVDPERLDPLPEGQLGLVRIDDAANLDSVSAIQTADLGVLLDGGLFLRGRAQGAVARGCSITADELLRGGRS